MKKDIGCMTIKEYYIFQLKRIPQFLKKIFYYKLIRGY